MVLGAFVDIVWTKNVSDKKSVKVGLIKELGQVGSELEGLVFGSLVSGVLPKTWCQIVRRIYDKGVEDQTLLLLRFCCNISDFLR
jgi:hypothetical protein